MPMVAAWIAAFSFAEFVQAIVVAAILGYISRSLFTPEARQPSIDAAARDRQVLVRSSTEPRRVVLGQALLSGPLAYLGGSGSNNEYVHLVIVLAGHECQEIGDIYFDDELVGDLDGSGNVTTGTFANLARIKKHLGAEDQTADLDLVAESAGAWTNDHRLQGMAYLYVRLLRDDTAFPSGVPQIRALVKGKKLADPRVSGSPDSPMWTHNWGLALRDYYLGDYGMRCEASEIDDAAFIAAANAADERVTVTYVTPAFTINAGTNQALFADDENRLQTGDVVTPATTGSLAGTGLTAGTPVYYIRVNATTGQFAISLGNARAGTALDLTGAGSGTHTLTPTPRVTASGTPGDPFIFEVDERSISLGDGIQFASTGTLPTGFSAATTYYAIKMRAGQLKAALTYADSLAGIAHNFSSAGSGLISIKQIDQARYTVNGTYTLGETPSAILSKLLVAGAGVQSYSQGVFRVFAGVYDTPTLTIDEDDLRGALTGSTGPDAKDIFNAVQGTFVDQWKYWQPSDFPPYESTSYQAMDAGEQIFTDIDLEMVTDPVRAQRLAKITLERARQGETLTLPCKLGLFGAGIWDTAEVSLAALGMEDEVFRVVGWRFAWDENGPGVDLSLRREDASIYAWNSSEAAHVAPGAEIALPALREVAAPVGFGSPAALSLTVERASAFPVASSDITVVIKIDWDAAPEPNGNYYEVQWKKTTDSTWQSARAPFAGDTEFRIKETDVAASYDARVRTVSRLEAKSDWLTGSIDLSTTPLQVDTDDVVVDAITSGTSVYNGTGVDIGPDYLNVEIARITLDTGGSSPVLLAGNMIGESSLFETDRRNRTGNMYLYREYDEGSTHHRELVTLTRQNLVAYETPGFSPSAFEFLFPAAIIFVDPDPIAGIVDYVLEGEMIDANAQVVNWFAAEISFAGFEIKR